MVSGLWAESILTSQILLAGVIPTPRKFRWIARNSPEQQIRLDPRHAALKHRVNRDNNVPHWWGSPTVASLRRALTRALLVGEAN